MPQIRSKNRTTSQKEGAEKRKSELPEKRKRQYKHILESERKEGRPEKTAKRIAMATVNKTRSKKGETKSKRTAA
jgi:hypothetical protein